MVYTYQNVMDEAQKAGVLEKFSPEDLNTAQKNPEFGMALVGLLRDESKAATETQRLIAGESMTKLRSSYGITGAGSASAGSSFSGGQSMSTPTAAGATANSAPTTYAEALDDYINMPGFSYNHENDPTYQAYAKQYLREGRRASEDTLAQMAAMTGGRVSSAALTTAQQVANQYAAELSDMVPALRQNAYSEYQNDRAAKYDVAAALKAKEDSEYQRLLDDENRKRLAEQDALDKYQVLGYATPEIAEILGIQEGTVNGSSPITYRTINQSVKEGGAEYFIVGTSRLTKEEIDKAVVAGQIIGVYNNEKGTVNYQWVEGKRQHTFNEQSNVSNMQGDDWIEIDGRRFSLAEVESGLMTGRFAMDYDPITDTVTYVKGSELGVNSQISTPGVRSGLRNTAKD